MNIKSQIITAVALSLLVSISWSAQPVPGVRRPSLDEVRPVLNEATQKAVHTLFGSTHSEVTLTEMEVIDMGSPGWKFTPNSTNEVPYWPVRITCAVKFTDEEGNSAGQKLGILYRVSRDEKGQCNAAFSDLFDASTLEERAAKLKLSRDTARRAKDEAGRRACINNLRQLDGAKQMWALERGKSETDTPTAAELKEYLSRKQMLACPEGGTYTIGPVNTEPACSINGHKL